MLDVRKIDAGFAGEVMSPISLAATRDQPTLNAIRTAMDEYGVLVFRNQAITDEEQLAFAQRWDGEIHSKTGHSALNAEGLGQKLSGSISNLGSDGEVRAAGDRMRAYVLANRLWHTDASFREPAGRYSMLVARVVPPVSAGTEYANMRSAYDALDEATKERIDGLHVHHSIAHSRKVLGFEFTQEEESQLQGAVQPLVRVNPRTGRRSLYLASHATRIVEMSLAEGRLLLMDLMQHATQPEFRYAHEWTVDDFVIWDNLATMHRAMPFDDTAHKRRLTRVTTLDMPLEALPVT